MSGTIEHFAPGVAYSALKDIGKSVRNWLARRKPLGDFGNPVYGRDFLDPGEQWGGKQAFVTVSLPFVFKRASVNPDVRIIMTGRRPRPTSLNPSRLFDHSWRAEVEQKTWRPNDKLSIPLAFMAETSGHHGFSGDLKGSPQITEGNEYQFRIEVFSEETRQAFEIYMRVPIYRRDSAISDSDTYPGDLFFLLTERDKPLADRRFDPAHPENRSVTIDPSGFGHGGHGTRPWGVPP